MPSLGNLKTKSKRASESRKQSRDEAESPYLKAMPLSNLSDVKTVKSEVNNGNILILRISPLASKSIEQITRAVNELCEFAESVGGDIARLGEERIVVCPPGVRIWRERVPVPKELPRAT